MSISAAVGRSTAVDGFDAGLQAAQQALTKLGRASVSFGLVIAANAYPLQRVLDGVGELFGEIPFLGFTTSAELTDTGRSRRSVLIGLISGDDIRAEAGWWTGFGQDSRACVENMLNTLGPGNQVDDRALLVVADGLKGDTAFLCDALSEDSCCVVGCLAGGDLSRRRTFQMGGRQVGSEGLAAASLGGEIGVGVGADHGWQPVGAVTRLTSVQGQWVHTLGDQRAGELYARLFGYEVSDWVRPPLSNLIRLYPLGLQDEGDQQGLVLRSPLRMDADGSLRMHTVLPEGGLAYLMVGSQERCLEAARRATRQALASLGPTTPKLAVVMVDAAWQALFDGQPEGEINAVREVLGDEVPIMGGYTFGQVARLEYGGQVLLLNQHIEVILFGEFVSQEPDESIS